MGAMNLAAGAFPAFLGKPLLNSDALDAGAVVVSSGDAFKHRALDMSRRTAATSLGQSGAGDAWTYQAKQYDGSSVNPQPVDCLALLNINFKRFKVEYRLAGSAWTIFPGADYTAVDFAADHLILPLDPAGAVPTADEWLITATDTQGGAVEKSLGMFIVCQQNIQASRGTSDLSNKLRETVVTVDLMDGSKDETVLLHTDLDYDFWSSPLIFHEVPDTEEPGFSGLRDDFFLFVPQPGKYPNAWYYCRVVPNTYDAQPFSMMGSDHRMRVAFQVEEVGKP